MKRIISLVIIAIMLTTVAFAAGRTFEEPVAGKLNIVVDGGTELKEAPAGKQVAVSIKLVNNTTISSLKLKLFYDEKLSVVKGGGDRPKITFDIRDPEDTSAMISSSVNEEERSIKLNWVSGEDQVVGDCTYATVTFLVAADAEVGSFLPITVGPINPNDVFDINQTNIEFNVIEGGVDVIDYIPGDVDRDGSLTNRDVIMFSRHLGGATPEGFSLYAADYDDNGTVDATDLEALFAVVCGYTYTLPDTGYGLSEVPADKLAIVVDGAESVYNGRAGQNVEVKIGLVNNPGVSSVKTVVYWADALTLVDATYDIYDAEDTSAYVNTADWTTVTNSFAFNWASGDNQVTGDVTFVTLTFAIPDTVEHGEFLFVAATADNVYNAAGSAVEFEVLNGGITVQNFLRGDTNFDGFIDNKDVVVLFRYASGSMEVTELMELVCDFDENEEVNNKDVVALFRFVSAKD